MLYLKGLTLSKFKSFKHAELLFSKGFTCIVGPNGSGKSNICDALLFGLGESSLKRLRAERLEDLVSNSARTKDGKATAHVKITLGGDEQMEILKVGRADGKSLFKVNGKTMSRSETVEILKRHNLNINETNTITQGEINEMMNLSPKGRRELIDIASGIQEFELKKQESLKELEKVNVKLGEANTLLGERMGWLKSLEKEKDDAEKYMALNSRLKSLKYSIIVTKLRESKDAYDRYTKDMAIYDAKKQQAEVKIKDATVKIDALALKVQELSKRFTDDTLSSGEGSGKLEAVTRELANLDSGIESSNNAIGDGLRYIEESTLKATELRERVTRNTAAVAELSSKVMGLDTAIKGIESAIDSSRDINEKLFEAKKKADALQERASGINVEISRLEVGISSTRSWMESEGSDLSGFEKEHKLQLERKSKLHDELAKAKDDLASVDREIASVASGGKELTEELSRTDSLLLDLREQRVFAASSKAKSVYERVSERFKQDDGMLGMAGELCTYELEDAYAVESAAGPRLDYLVVDTMSTAAKIIEYLRKNNIGRTTIIPISELHAEQTREEKGIKRAIDMVKFEEKYRKVFEYIFSNTYLIGSIEDSKRFGIERHRYVTREGDVIEQSGTVSGGAMQKKHLSINAIDNQIRSLAESKKQLGIQISGMEAKMFELRKRRARYEQEMSVHAAELSALSLQLESTDSIIAKRKSVLVQQGEMLKRYEKDISAKMSEMSGVSAELKEAKEIADRMYEQSASKRKKASQSRLDEERASLDARRKEREDLMVRIAQMQKESEMFGIQARELADNAGKRKSLIANLKEELAELGKRRSAVAKAKSELEDRIRKSGEQNKKAYEQLQSFQDAVNKLVSERSLLSSELDRAESQLGEKRLLRNQIETRISDYEAEVAAYGKETFADGKAEDMDKEIAVLSSKIADLGNVNLKAPESYELKKRDVELANERITTLNGERESILKMIEEIDSKKTKVFLDTLEQVNKNFVRLYGAILPGKASMELSDMKDIFNSGLYIRISSLRNKKTKIGEANPDQGAAQTYMKNMDSLSGGQKSMILLVLLFAIHTYKPSPLYIFDEIDSALDKENSKKLSQLIKMLSKSSQFVVVSHNDTLISDADIAIGVTSVNDESRAVGIEVSSILNDRKPNPGSGQPKLENLSAEMEIKSRSAKGADSGA